MAINSKKINTENLSGNIDLGFSINKKRFSVNGDTNKIIEFNPSDLGMPSRLAKALPKFNDLDEKWKKLNLNKDNLDDSDTDSQIKNLNDFSKQFDEIEQEIRDIIDYVFDGDVADKLLGNSSAFTLEDGFFRYERIITGMVKCYEQNIQDEAPKFNKRKVSQYIHKNLK